MGALESNTTNIYGVHLRESANDGSDFSNAAADYRVVFLGEDGELHAKDSSGTVTALGSSGSLTDHTHAVTGSGATGGGATVSPTTLSPSGIVAFTGGITSSINADQNDFNPGSLHAISWIYFDSLTANRTITGINAGTSGELLFLQNNTAFSLLLAHESASSSANNRFRSPNGATHTIRQRGSALCIYIQSRWCIVAA
jgi:hypothetical protein